MQQTIQDSIHELKLSQSVYADVNLESALAFEISKHDNFSMRKFITEYRDICGEGLNVVASYDFQLFTVWLAEDFTGRKAVVVNSQEIQGLHLECTFRYFLDSIKNCS